MNASADPPVICSIAVSASVDVKSSPIDSWLPSVVPISMSIALTRPCVSMSVSASAAPSAAIAAVMPFDGFSNPSSTPLSCVLTSAVEPVTPARAENPAKSSSCRTPSAAAFGVTRPMAAPSSGNDVWPSRTVTKARSATCCTAAAESSPYALVTALVSRIASLVVATPAVAAVEAMRRISIVRPARSPKAEIV